MLAASTWFESDSRRQRLQSKTLIYFTGLVGKYCDVCRGMCSNQINRLDSNELKRCSSSKPLCALLP